MNASAIAQFSVQPETFRVDGKEQVKMPKSGSFGKVLEKAAEKRNVHPVHKIKVPMQTGPGLFNIEEGKISQLLSTEESLKWAGDLREGWIQAVQSIFRQQSSISGMEMTEEDRLEEIAGRLQEDPDLFKTEHNLLLAILQALTQTGVKEDLDRIFTALPEAEAEISPSQIESLLQYLKGLMPAAQTKSQNYQGFNAAPPDQKPTENYTIEDMKTLANLFEKYRLHQVLQKAFDEVDSEAAGRAIPAQFLRARGKVYIQNDTGNVLWPNLKQKNTGLKELAQGLPGKTGLDYERGRHAEKGSAILKISDTFLSKAADEDAKPARLKTLLNNIPKVSPEERDQTAKSGQDFANLNRMKGAPDYFPQLELKDLAVKIARSDGQRVSYQEFVDQFQAVLSRSNLFTNGNIQRLTVKLYPERLGTLQIELVQKQDEIIAKIISSTKSAKDLLESQVHALRQAFAQQNINVNRIDIENHWQYESWESEQGFQHDSHGQSRQQDQNKEDQQAASTFQETLLNVEI